MCDIQLSSLIFLILFRKTSSKLFIQGFSVAFTSTNFHPFGSLLFVTTRSLVWKFPKKPFQHIFNTYSSVKHTWLYCCRDSADIVGKEGDAATFQLMFLCLFRRIGKFYWRGCVALTGVVSILLSFKVPQLNSVPHAAFQALYFSINHGSKCDTGY